MIQGNLTANNTLVFNASDDYPLQGEIVSYYWDLGDGKNAIGKTFNHSYVHPGNYTVTLTVTDSFGQQYSESTVLMVGSSQLVHLKETSGSLSIVLIVGLLAGIIVLIVGLVVFIRRR
jgi:PKD repeat protein